MARYIDVDALKNDGHICYHDGKGNTYYEVDHAPTADVAEVKHGEWIHSNRGFNIQGDYECSNCHSPSGIKHFYNGDKYTYCPDCGAKMDGGNDHGKEEQTSEDI